MSKDLIYDQQVSFAETSRDQRDRLFISKTHLNHTHKGLGTATVTTKQDGAFSAFGRHNEISMSRNAPQTTFGLTTGREYHLQQDLKRSISPGPGCEYQGALA